MNVRCRIYLELVQDIRGVCCCVSYFYIELTIGVVTRGTNLAIDDISKKSVVCAIDEFDKKGIEQMLEEYGGGRSRKWFIEFNGQMYDQKLIIRAAHRLQGLGKAPTFKAVESRKLLEKLGFKLSGSRNVIVDTHRL